MLPVTAYHFFWGGPLSQWAQMTFTGLTGLEFSCAEQYMMAYKARLFKDDEVFEAIMRTSNPREQKKLGRRVKNFDPKLWDKHKRKAVFQGNLYRAQQNENFRTLLVKTNPLILVEASPYDRIWGIGYNEANAMANYATWGQNLLGQALMEVRDIVSAESLEETHTKGR